MIKQENSRVKLGNNTLRMFVNYITLYCPGSGQELLSALGLIKVCQDSKNFLMRELPLSMIDALLQSMTWSLNQA